MAHLLEIESSAEANEYRDVETREPIVSDTFYVVGYIDEKPWIDTNPSPKRDILAKATSQQQAERLLKIEVANWRRRMRQSRCH